MSDLHGRVLIVDRESRGHDCAVHTLGRNENGLGATGMQLSECKARWWGGDCDPMLGHPEMAAMMAFAKMHTAMGKCRARTPVAVQAVYGGSVYYVGKPGRRKCRANVRPRHEMSMRWRMPRTWRKRVRPADLGLEIPLWARRSVVALMVLTAPRRVAHSQEK